MALITDGNRKLEAGRFRVMGLAWWEKTLNQKRCHSEDTTSWYH